MPDIDLRLLALRMALACVVVLRPITAGAQTEPDPAETARFQQGTIAFTPAIVFSDGYDTNVYREPVGFADHETFAVPQIEGFWTQPAFHITFNAAAEFVHFANHPGAANNQAGVRIDRKNALFRPYVSFNRKHTTANPTGFEVGYKSLRLEREASGGFSVPISPRTNVGGNVRFVGTRWDADARYETSSLREKLNRNTLASSVSISYAFTPLTAVGTSVEISRDRFIFSPSRDGDTLRVSTNASFARPALIFGAASVGYERFRSPDSGAADFSGIAGTVNLGWGDPAGTLVKLQVNRGVQYSYDTALAYFVLTGINLTAARRLGGRWDTALFANRFSMDYRPAGTTASVGRINYLDEFGGAIAYRIGPWIRLGVSTERAEEHGTVQFGAVRAVMFLTYGSGRFQRLDRPTPFER
ncbi:MAG TPA: outer membrane beta-barrel protein [Vicinamibacterales bacterium]